MRDVNSRRTGVILLLLGALAGCGGSGSSDSSEPETPPVVVNPEPNTPEPNPPEPNIPDPDPVDPDPMEPDPEPSEPETALLRAMLGPLQNAQVTAYRLGEFSVPLESTMTASTTDMEEAGSFQLFLNGVDDQEWVLVVVSQGNDLDFDDDGQMEVNPTPNSGVLRLVAQAGELKAGHGSVTLVTEIAYRMLKYQELTPSLPESRMNEIANALLDKDLNADGAITYADVMAWSPKTNQNAFKIPYTRLLDRNGSPLSIHDNVFQEHRVHQQFALLWEQKTDGPLVDFKVGETSGKIYLNKEKIRGGNWQATLEVDPKTGQITEHNRQIILPNSPLYQFDDGRVEVYLSGVNGPEIWQVDPIRPGEKTAIAIAGNLDEFGFKQALNSENYSTLALSDDRTHLFLAGGAIFAVIDVSNPYSPRVVYSNKEMSGYYAYQHGGEYGHKKMFVVGTRLYVTFSRSEAIQEWDISNPAEPVFIKRLSLPGLNWNWRINEDKKVIYSSDWGPAMVVTLEPEMSLSVLHYVDNQRTHLIVDNVLLVAGGTYSAREEEDTGYIQAYDLDLMASQKPIDPPANPYPCIPWDGTGEPPYNDEDRVGPCRPTE